MVTPETIAKYSPSETIEDSEKESFDKEQPLLARQVRNYLDVVRKSEPLWADAAEFAIFDMYALIEAQS